MCRLLLLALSLCALAATSAAAQTQAQAQAQGGHVRVIEFRADVPMSEDTLAFAPELVWSMLPHIFNELGLPGGESVDSASREFLTPYLEVRGQLFGRRNHEFFQCQENGFGMDLVDNANLIFAIMMRVLPGPGGGTILRTQADARAHRRDMATNVVECATTGNLEKALAGVIAQRLREMSPPTP